MNENGDETTRELHFFYDAQSRPAFVEYDGAMYRYIHNLRGDIVAIVNGDETTQELHFFYDPQSRPAFVEYDGVMYRYIHNLQGDIVAIVNGDETTQEFHFFYDPQSRPAFVEYDGAMYSYIHNLQGDIVAIVDAAGNPVVEYRCDAWGRPLSAAGAMATIPGVLNPFRYRGYIYDREAELNDLRSRHYNSNAGRVMNADNTMGRRGIYLPITTSPIARTIRFVSGHSWGLAALLGLAVKWTGCSSANNLDSEANKHKYNCYAVGKTVWLYIGGQSVQDWHAASHAF